MAIVKSSFASSSVASSVFYATNTSAAGWARSPTGILIEFPIGHTTAVTACLSLTVVAISCYKVFVGNELVVNAHAVYETLKHAEGSSTSV
jgi:hypothetical protein